MLLTSWPLYHVFIYFVRKGNLETERGGTNSNDLRGKKLGEGYDIILYLVVSGLDVDKNLPSFYLGFDLMSL